MPYNMVAGGAAVAPPQAPAVDTVSSSPLISQYAMPSSTSRPPSLTTTNGVHHPGSLGGLQSAFSSAPQPPSITQPSQIIDQESFLAFLHQPAAPPPPKPDSVAVQLEEVYVAMLGVRPQPGMQLIDILNDVEETLGVVGVGTLDERVGALRTTVGFS
jgi:hypothetical protein